MTRPVMPDDEAFEYLPTQAVADFLATEASVPLDGIIFPSAQTADESRKVVLFHKAARVAVIPLPPGVTIKAQSREMDDEGWRIECTVIEEVPSAEPEAEPLAKKMTTSNGRLLGPRRDPTLRIDLESVEVRHVEAVQFTTTPYPVRRMQWEKHRPDF